MRHSPDPGPLSLSPIRRWLRAWILIPLLASGTVRASEAQETPEDESKAPVPVVKTVENPANPGISAPVRATPPRLASTPEGQGKGPRTLDEINIEGEIAVPQVLFITARDRKRYRDLLHRRYLENSAEIGRELTLPARLGCILGS
jgi:hypothetical protein